MGVFVIVKVLFFIKDCSFRVVQIFCMCIGIKCFVFKGNVVVVCIVNRKDNLVVKLVIGCVVIIRYSSKFCINYQFGIDVFVGEMFKDCIVFGCIVDVEFVLCFLRYVVLFKIGVCFSSCVGFQSYVIELYCLFYYFDKLVVVVGFFLCVGIVVGYLYVGFFGEDFYGFYEVDIFGFLNEFKGIVFGVIVKVIIKVFIVIYMKRCGFFVVERVWCLYVVFVRIGFVVFLLYFVFYYLNKVGVVV